MTDLRTASKCPEKNRHSPRCWKSLARLVLKSSKIFLHLELSLEMIGKFSEVVGNLRRSSEVFGKLWKASVNIRILRFSGDETSLSFNCKKGAGIRYCLKRLAWLQTVSHQNSKVVRVLQQVMDNTL